MTCAASDEMGPVTYTPDMEQVSSERQRAEALLLATPGVRGMGEGRDELGNAAWIAYIVDQGAALRLPKRIGNRKVLFEVTGEIDARPC